MNFVKRFLLLVLCVMPVIAGAEPVATTAGNNLTAWNGNAGATNNNTWNTMMNSRTLASGNVPSADYGNCNSLILRCAQPKCSGCTSIELARPIVEGCVNSNASCKQYVEAGLVDYIAAQIVSNAAARIQEQQIAAQNAAAAQAAAQNNAQMQQMQAQMMQMQQQMAEQNAAQMAQMQAALAEQKAVAAQAQADALAAQQAQQTAAAATATVSGGTITTTQLDAVKNSGADPDMVARQTISGEILTEVENAELKLKELYATMQTAFTYAGCDMRGNNCKGPKRVKTFKDKAQLFFQPYDEIVDNMYEALELALAVGVDISDVIMMLNGACNRWGIYACTTDDKTEFAQYYDGSQKKPKRDDDEVVTCVNGKSQRGGSVRGGFECQNLMTVPPQDDVRCSLVSIIDGSDPDDKIMRKWLDDTDPQERLGCATSTLDSLAIFGRRRSKNANSMVTLDVLERILLQDAPDFAGNNRFTKSGGELEKIKYCGLSDKGYQNLLNVINAKKLPKNICVDENALERNAHQARVVGTRNGTGLTVTGYISAYVDKNMCEETAKQWVTGAKECEIIWDDTNKKCYSTDCAYENGELRKMMPEEKSAWEAILGQDMNKQKNNSSSAGG